MKHFAFGLALGSVTGIILSMISDTHGKRLGTDFKNNVKQMATDINQFQDGLEKATNAKLALTENLPAARRAVSDIKDDLSKYQIHTKYRRDQIKKQEQKIRNNPLAKKVITEFEGYLQEEYESAQKNKDKNS